MTARRPESHGSREGMLERALRREAREIREEPAPERAARILAALEGVERRESLGTRSRHALAAAAALLLVAAGWWAWGRSPEGVRAPGRPEVEVAGTHSPSGARDHSESSGGSSGGSGRGALGLGLDSWANQSLAALRSGVDDPLQREVRALSRDAGRVLRRVRLDVTGVLGRLLDAPR